MAKKYRSSLHKDLDDLLKDLKKTHKNIWDDVDDVRSKLYRYKKEVTKSKEEREEEIQRKQKEEEIENIINNNKNIKTMVVGQDNLKDAAKFTRFYKYSVKVVDHRYPDKMNYVFGMDKSFMKKLLSKPTERFHQQTGRVNYNSIVFKYKPKVSREFVDDTLTHFEPFEIVLSTKDCHDFVYFHTENNGQGQEVLKGLHILNLSKVLEKLNEKAEELELSDKAKINMTSSIKKHLANVQSEERYGVDGWEEFTGHAEEIALMILDDYDDGDLTDSLGGYLLD